jgi:hypothetical protein
LGWQNDATAEPTERSTGKRATQMWRADKDDALYSRVRFKDE